MQQCLVEIDSAILAIDTGAVQQVGKFSKGGITACGCEISHSEVGMRAKQSQVEIFSYVQVDQGLISQSMFSMWLSHRRDLQRGDSTGGMLTFGEPDPELYEVCGRAPRYGRHKSGSCGVDGVASSHVRLDVMQSFMRVQERASVVWMQLRVCVCARARVPCTKACNPSHSGRGGRGTGKVKHGWLRHCSLGFWPFSMDPV